MTRNLLACTALVSALSLGAAHAATTTTINVGGSSLAYPTYVAEFKAFTSSNPTDLFSYEAVGSGGGQKAFLNNDITQFENLSTSILTYGTIVGTQVDIGASDATMGLNTATSGDVNGLTTAQGGVYTGTYTGAVGSSAADGPLIQIPTFGVPITLTYNETSAPAAGLTLTDAKICGIMSGKISDWHTLVSTIPAGTTIHVVVRSDSSGTTFLFTQHLNAVCNSTNSSFPAVGTLPAGQPAITKTFSTLFPSGMPANFSSASGSGAVQTGLLQTSASFGYLSPDYTNIAPLSLNSPVNAAFVEPTGVATGTTLPVAKVVNTTNGIAYLPTVANVTTGLAHAGPTSTNATPPATAIAAANPQNWVPNLPTTTAGYPIVGYTTMDLSSCYASNPAGAAIIKFLGNQYKNTAYQTIIKNNGFVPLINTAAVKYASAVTATLLSNTSGYALNINNATTCAAYTGR